MIHFKYQKNSSDLWQSLCHGVVVLIAQSWVLIDSLSSFSFYIKLSCCKISALFIYVVPTDNCRIKALLSWVWWRRKISKYKMVCNWPKFNNLYAMWLQLFASISSLFGHHKREDTFSLRFVRCWKLKEENLFIMALICDFWFRSMKGKSQKIDLHLNC